MLPPSRFDFCLLLILLSNLLFQTSYGERRYSISFNGFDKNQSIDNIIDGNFSNGSFNDSNLTNLEAFYSTLNINELPAAFDHTIHKLIQLKKQEENSLFPMDEGVLLVAINNSTKYILEEALSNTALTEDFQNNISKILFENFISHPDGLVSVDRDASSLIGELSKLYMQSVQSLSDTSSLNDSVSATLSSVFDLYTNGNPNGLDYNNTSFFPGVENVAKNDQNQSDLMLFGGVSEFYNFDPKKTSPLNISTQEIVSIYFEEHFVDVDINDANKSSEIENLSLSLINTISDFITDIGSDGNEAFIYEILKQVSSAVTTSSTIHLFSNSSLAESGVALELTEELTRSLSYQAVKLLTASNDQLEMNKISEAIAFGSSMGAQNEHVLSTISSHTSNLSNTRKLISQSLAYGNSKGSLEGAADLSLSDTSIGWDEIKIIASHASKGSMVANVSNAIYFGEDEDLLPIINFSAQGSTFGATSTLALNNIQKPEGLTEDLSVEVARSSSHGSSLGALFSTVALKNGDPISNENDLTTIDSVKAVTYGSTIGSILGASESGNGDPVVVQQASKQGVTEGSLIGSGFATDYQENFFDANGYDDMEVAAKKNMLLTISSMNADASLEAMNSLATKKVKTSSRDMLLLIRKFNISPNTTNPATIYQRPSSKQSGSDFPFQDTFPPATPI